MNIADPTYIMSRLFPPVGPAPPFDCEDAADVNDDGAIDIADPVVILNWLFSSGPDPVAPFPNCGVDPTSDGFACDNTSC